MYNMNAKVRPVVKPYCKVCHDAGKSEEEYTSHFVKSEPGANGKVVCPTLLNQNCRFCHKKGHTVSRCREIARINKEKEKDHRRMIYKDYKNNMEKSVEKIAKKTQIAAAFDEENDEIVHDEIVHKKNPKEEFPRLSLQIPSCLNTFKKETRNYAQALEKPQIPIPVLSRTMTKTFPTNEKPFVAKYEEPTSPSPTPRPNPRINTIPRKSWADDWSSSEDEDEDNTDCVDAW